MEKLKMRKLRNFDVQELNSQDTQNINGGWFWPIAAGAIVYEIASDWDNFKAGIAGNAPI